MANASKVCQQKVGNRSPSDCLPIGNPNNQHNINSLSANADATLRRRVAYLVIAYLLLGWRFFTYFNN
ncbi:MAG: hypothetical protein LBU34_02660 [Planctomycetaceae bacterium]|nr:hypothetical protein [Planctomycetaceae bacterium]